MKVIVAGAGHGGLTAAAKLAKQGAEVTVIEKSRKDGLGHDWEDRFTFDVLLDAVEEKELPENSWRYRGDCAFVSPSYNTKVVINYDYDKRQKIMYRKPVINMLLDYAEKCGVHFVYETEIKEPITENNKVCGIKTASGDYLGDLVIDACGVFSPIRSKLPESFGIEKMPERGDVFYAYRAYFEKTDKEITPAVPFEVYLYHAKEQGLSWCCTNDDSVDILIGRIDPLKDEKVKEHINNFKKIHPYIGDKILHGGVYGVIPVRRPLSLMVANGYAAVGDSAFMTTPMNGMGIDLSISAGKLLAQTIIENNFDVSVSTLWKYNRDFHKLYGGDTAKNEGLKNALLQLPGEGVDFLFDNKVIQAADLAGAGKNMNFSALIGKLVNGMKNPKYFFAIIGGLIKGAANAKQFKNAPREYDSELIRKWSNKIAQNVVKITRT